VRFSSSCCRFFFKSDQVLADCWIVSLWLC
jgi:hypothetical protein